MKRRAWVVGNGNAGCLFDNQEVFNTRRDAEAWARQLAAEMRKEGRRIDGSARYGLYTDRNSTYYIEIYPISAEEAAEYER